jgi:hypothetical protein
MVVAALQRQRRQLKRGNPPFGASLDRLAQQASNGRLTVAQFSRDRARALAALVQQMDSTAIRAS